jgi:hypothetical protein
MLTILLTKQATLMKWSTPMVLSLPLQIMFPDLNSQVLEVNPDSRHALHGHCMHFIILMGLTSAEDNNNSV